MSLSFLSQLQRVLLRHRNLSSDVLTSPIRIEELRCLSEYRRLNAAILTSPASGHNRHNLDSIYPYPEQQRKKTAQRAYEITEPSNNQFSPNHPCTCHIHLSTVDLSECCHDWEPIRGSRDSRCWRGLFPRAFCLKLFLGVGVVAGTITRTVVLVDHERLWLVFHFRAIAPALPQNLHCLSTNAGFGSKLKRWVLHLGPHGLPLHSVRTEFSAWTGHTTEDVEPSPWAPLVPEGSLDIIGRIGKGVVGEVHKTIVVHLSGSEDTSPYSRQTEITLEQTPSLENTKQDLTKNRRIFCGIPNND